MERLYAHAVSGEPNRVYISRFSEDNLRDLAQDLAAAGMPLVTEHGKAVFHSLRITYINLVLDLGVNPKEAQQLARHSTVNLTMNVYGRTRSEYLSGVVERCTSRCVQLLCNWRRRKSRLPLRLLAMRECRRGDLNPHAR